MLRKANIKRDTCEFKRDIEQAAFNPRSKRVMAERVMRYFEDSLQDMVSIYVFLIVRILRTNDDHRTT